LIGGLPVSIPAFMAVEFAKSNLSAPPGVIMPAVGPVSERVKVKSFERNPLNCGRSVFTTPFCMLDTLKPLPRLPAWFCAEAVRMQQGVTTSVAAKMVIIRIIVPFSDVSAPPKATSVRDHGISMRNNQASSISSAAKPPFGRNAALANPLAREAN
jgi:hypothetical protein